MTETEHNEQHPIEGEGASMEHRETHETGETTLATPEKFAEEMQQQVEALHQEDAKIDSMNESIGLSAEEVEQEKSAMNLSGEMEAINTEADKLVSETTAELATTTPQEASIPAEAAPFIAEKAREEKFSAFEAEYEKYAQSQPAQGEYPVEAAKKTLESVFEKPQEVNSIVEGMPKAVAEDIMKDQYGLSNSAIKNWERAIGGRIGQLSKDRMPTYDKDGKINGDVSSDPRTYLATVANASRFVPRTVSESFVKDAVSHFTNAEKRNNSDARFFATTESHNQRNNIVRNLIEAGYGDSAKELLTAEVKNKQLSPSQIFEYQAKGLLSKEDVKAVLTNAGALEDAKPEPKNESWG